MFSVVSAAMMPSLSPGSSSAAVRPVPLSSSSDCLPSFLAPLLLCSPSDFLCFFPGFPEEGGGEKQREGVLGGGMLN